MLRNIMPTKLLRVQERLTLVGQQLSHMMTLDLTASPHIRTRSRPETTRVLRRHMEQHRQQFIQLQTYQDAVQLDHLDTAGLLEQQHAITQEQDVLQLLQTALQALQSAALTMQQ